jgi:hypothetical protein
MQTIVEKFWPHIISKGGGMNLNLMLWPMVSRPVCLGIKHPSGAYDQILIISDSCGFVYLGRPFWREDGSVVYNCYWPSPAQSFLGLSPLGLVTIFYCLWFETSQEEDVEENLQPCFTYQKLSSTNCSEKKANSARQCEICSFVCKMQETSESAGS